MEVFAERIGNCKGHVCLSKHAIHCFITTKYAQR